MSPEQIARLTDWQIIELYLRPAIRRADEFARKSQQTPHNGPTPIGTRRTTASAECGPDYEPGTPEHRRQIVEMAFMGVMGLSREKAEQKYDAQLAEWNRQQQER